MMSVPEASMNEHRESEFRKHDIGSAGQIFFVQAVAEARSMQCSSYGKLWGRIERANCSHGSRTLLFRKSVCHWVSELTRWGRLRFYLSRRLQVHNIASSEHAGI
jgi:hypothetical protein